MARRVEGGTAACEGTEGRPPPKAPKKAATEPRTGLLRMQWSVIPLPYYFTAERRDGAQPHAYTFVNTSTKHPTTNVNVCAHFTYTSQHVNLHLAMAGRGTNGRGAQCADVAPRAGMMRGAPDKGKKGDGRWQAKACQRPATPLDGKSARRRAGQESGAAGTEM